jgi:transposase InsO family protein
MNASIRASSSISISKSSAGSAPSGTASPGDILAPSSVTTAFGWEFVHVCIDDPSRVAFVQVMADQRKESAVAFLEAAVAYYAKLGIRIERVMTDNGSCYRSKSFQAACKRLGLRQVFTKPYTPRTNRKAERFIQTALREWAYARASDQRSAEMFHWLHRYNWQRPHGSLKANTPISRLGPSEDNLLRLQS